MNTYPEINKLNIVRQWPTRTLPQVRFDSDITEVMNQISAMIDQFNSDFIPKLNEIVDKFTTDGENNNDIATQASVKVNEAMDTISEIQDTLTSALTSISTLTTNLASTESKASEAMSSKIPILGLRGILGGYNQVMTLSGNQDITVNTSDYIVVSTSGNVTLSFLPSETQFYAIKRIMLVSTSSTILTINGASWANDLSMPVWGNAGETLLLEAHFVNGKIILMVIDNSQKDS